MNFYPSGISNIIIWAIRFYKKNISKYFGSVCIYSPTCSQYAVEAIERYGPLKGVWLFLKRISWCRIPYSGGYDPVP